MRAVETSIRDNTDAIQYRGLQTLLDAAEESNVYFRSMTISNVLELQEGYTWEAFSLAMPFLRTLKLDINMSRWSSDYRVPAKWLSTLTGLRELIGLSSTMLSDHFIEVGLFHFLNNWTFPSLQALVVKKKVKVTYESLGSFVDKHKETLKSLNVTWPRMDADQWAEFRKKYAKVEGMATALTTEHLQVTDLVEKGELLGVKCDLYDGGNFVKEIPSYDLDDSEII